MGFSRLVVMYGHIDGAQGKFARDPSGHLAVEAGIFQKKGLEVSWQHVQGTEERYRKLEDGSAHISFVVGRAALQHFLSSKKTRILGASMNTCPYYLIIHPAVRKISDLKGKSLSCMQSVARIAPLAQAFQEKGLEKDVNFSLGKSDQDAFDLLIRGEVQAALLPRPYGFLAEENGFNRVADWPDVVDDPLPVMIETTEALLGQRANEFSAFLEAHREGIRYLKSNRDETVRMLAARFGHSPALAAKSYDDYLVCLDDRLTVDFSKLEKLVAQIAPDLSAGIGKLASEWLIPGSLRS